MSYPACVLFVLPFYLFNMNSDAITCFNDFSALVSLARDSRLCLYVDVYVYQGFSGCIRLRHLGTCSTRVDRYSAALFLWQFVKHVDSVELGFIPIPVKLS